MGQTILNIELPDRKKGARPQRKFVDVLKEDVWTAGVMEEDARGRVRWI